MINMHSIRERSHIILWTLLIFFLASMTVGGLVGGANIMDKILGRNQQNLYVGTIDGHHITHQQFRAEQDKQLTSQRQSGSTIDSRAIQNARNSAWNTIVDQIIQDEKIKDLGLSASADEIYDFMLLTPPKTLQDQLTKGGFFADSTGAFQLNDYQSALRTGSYPATLDQFWLVWENYLRTYLPNRKIRDIYNHTASVSEYETRRDFEKKNINCSIEYLYVLNSNIDDSLIVVSDDEVLERYNDDKDKLYKIDPSKTVDYVFWSTQNTDIDSTMLTAYSDSLNSVALQFAGEADFSSFYAALDTFKVSVTDTLDITENYKNNSGIPFRMGVMRDAVRFAFDNPIGSISDPLTPDNGVAVFHLIGEKPSSFKPLGEVSDNIRKSLIREKKKDYALQVLQESYDNSEDFPAIADSHELVEFAADSSKAIGGSFKSIGRSNALTGTLRAMSVGEVSEAIQTFSAVAIVRLLEKDEFDPDKYAEEHDKIRDQLLSSKQNSIYSSWLGDYKKNITIEDMRSKSY